MRTLLSPRRGSVKRGVCRRSGGVRLGDEHVALARLGRYVEEERGLEDDVVQRRRRRDDRRLDTGGFEEWVGVRTSGSRQRCPVARDELVRNPKPEVAAQVRTNDELVHLPCLPGKAHLEATVGPETLHAARS